MIPGWWSDYVRGRLHTPSALFFASRADLCLGDGPDTWFQRFDGSPVDTSIPALVRLRYRAGFGSDRYYRQQAQANWAYVPGAVRSFVGGVLKAALAVQVPLYVIEASPTSVLFGHCRFGTFLLPDEWQVVSWLCQRGEDLDGIDVSIFGRDPSLPDGLVLFPSLIGPWPDPAAVDPVRLTPARLMDRWGAR